MIPVERCCFVQCHHKTGQRVSVRANRVALANLPNEYPPSRAIRRRFRRVDAKIVPPLVERVGSVINRSPINLVVPSHSLG